MKTLILIFTLLTQSFAFAASGNQIEITQKMVTSALKELKTMDDEKYRKTMFEVADNHRKLGKMAAAQQIENLALDPESREDLMISLEEGVLKSSENGLLLFFLPLICGDSKSFSSGVMCIFTVVFFALITLEGEKASDF